jgi:hypothetical protein
MPGNSSAYAALGLEPGARPAAIDEAYKRLIKQHHPDRAGGDAERAAEINRAYRELKRAALRPAGFEKGSLDLHEHPVEKADHANRWSVGAMVVIVGVSAVVLAFGPIRPPGTSGLAAPVAHRATSVTDPMDRALAAGAIDASVRNARELSHSGDEMALAQTSATCHHELRAHPSLWQLDRCVAFDDAVVLLQDRDPLRDRGPFSELAVTGRQWSAASALSNDYLAIDGRLDRVRLRVEMALAPELPPDSD